MRLVSAVLFVALTGSTLTAALADDVKPADPQPEVAPKAKTKVPYRVVKMLPESGQVLLFNKNKGNYVVAEVGQGLVGYTVNDIDEDEVTLIAENGASVILTAPLPPRAAKRAAKPAAPVDPYSEPGADVTAETDPATAPHSVDGPVDPYLDPEPPKTAGEDGVRVASAADPSTATTDAPRSVSADPGAGAVPGSTALDPGIAAFVDAVGAHTTDPATPTPGKPAKPAKPTKGKPAKPAAPAPDAASALASAATGSPATASPAAPKAVPAGTIVIARSELDAALADFSKLAGTFRATFTPDGLRFDSVSEGTLLAKAGLRKGDIVTYVDGQALRSLDDAASLYARAGTLRATTVQVTRDGKLVTLHLAIQ
ncbi:MAG TPA: PDZ domain-containing protein [Kofleriaceae bacterium]